MMAMIWTVIVFIFRLLVLFVIFASMLPDKKRQPKRWPSGRIMKREKRRYAPAIESELAAPTLPFAD